MAASVDSIISEMNGMRDFLTSFTLSMAARPDEAHATKTAMVRSVIAKIHMLPHLDFAGGARITDAASSLASDNIIDSDMRDLLTTSLVQKMQGQPICGSGSRKEP